MEKTALQSALQELRRSFLVSSVMILILKVFFSSWFNAPITEYFALAGFFLFLTFLLFWFFIVMPRDGKEIYTESEGAKIMMMLFIIVLITGLSRFGFGLDKLLLIALVSANALCTYWGITLLIADQAIKRCKEEGPENELPAYE